MATCNPQELIDAAPCFSCLTPRELKNVATLLLCKIVDPVATCDPKALMASAACFSCLPTHQIDAIQTQLLCEILQQGTPEGQACLFCGEGDPVADPSPCQCALYYNTVLSEFWYWDDGDGQWYKFG